MLRRTMLFLLAAGVSVFSLPVAANEASPADTLQATRSELARAQARAKAMAERTTTLEAEKTQLQQQLVALAAALQHNEREITLAEEKLAILQRQFAEKETALMEERARLDAMMRAAVRFSEMPPEAAVMMPGNPQDVMDAARAVGLIAESIRARTQALSGEMEALLQLKEKVQDNHAALMEARQKLRKQQQEMDEGVRKRAELSERTLAERAEAEEKVRALARKSEDMQTLVAALEKEREAAEEARAREQESARKKKESRRKELRKFAAAKGDIRLPAAGNLLQRFSAQHKGIALETRPGARVTAPFDGEVVFTGPFLNYGQMVIIRHTDSFHTLIAGLAEIDTKTGEFLLEGEPIGAMGEENPPPQLYLELRKDNQPVDPAPWITGVTAKANRS